MSQEAFNLATFILAIVAFIATAISLYYIYRQVVVAQRTRETDVLLRLYEISTREPLFSDFDVVWELRHTQEPSATRNASCLRVALFFEMLGSIASQRYVDTTLIEEFFGALITGCHDAMRQYIEFERKKPYNDKFALNFERLALLMQDSPRISRPLGRHKSSVGRKRWFWHPR